LIAIFSTPIDFIVHRSRDARTIRTSSNCYTSDCNRNTAILSTYFLSQLFRLDAWALSVIATATWLAGWVAGWLSHSGIVSKRLNLSENFLDHLKATSF